MNPAMKDERWLGLRHLALKVADVERSKRFYVELFGMRVEWEPDADNVYLTSGQDNLALHRADTAPIPKAGTLDHLGFVVTHPEEVDRWYERACRYGADIARKVRAHRDGARSFYLSDPDGNLIQILYHPPLSGLPGGPDPCPDRG